MVTNAHPHPILVVGLGNPGKNYTLTRHNIGFLVIDALCHLAQTQLASFNPTPENKYNSHLWHYRTPKHWIMLLKPQTFMNKSGHAVQAIMQFYKLPPQQIIIIHDDVNFHFGEVALKASGKSGGHNGLNSIITFIGSDFIRLKTGIGTLRPPPSSPPASITPLASNNNPPTSSIPSLPLQLYVLRPFAAKETALLQPYCQLLARIVFALAQTHLSSYDYQRMASLVNRKYFKDIDLSQFKQK